MTSGEALVRFNREAQWMQSLAMKSRPLCRHWTKP